jgi:hypothetical protein
VGRCPANTLASITEKKAGFRSLADTCADTQLQRQPPHHFPARSLDFVFTPAKQLPVWQSISQHQAHAKARPNTPSPVFRFGERRQNFKTTLPGFSE